MRRWLAWALCACSTHSALAQAQAAPAAEIQQAPAAPVLTLVEALRLAHERHPSLRQAHASSEINAARVDQARAPLLPQVTGTLGYKRATGNYAPTPGNGLGGRSASSSFDTYNSFNAGVTATQLIYDFGQATRKYDAAKANLQAQAQNERAAQLLVELNVRAAYFNVAAASAMLQVGSDTLANQQRHLTQIQGFVEVGTRPQIDLAQARMDVANARLGVIQADGNYRAAKAQLNLAMGSPEQAEYSVNSEILLPITGEESPVSTLMDEALKQRAEFAALVEQRHAQELLVRSVDAGYWPTLSASTGLTEAGVQLGNLAWNWNAGLLLNWPIFQGGLTKGQAREARANLIVLDAQLETLRDQVRLELEQAWLAVRTAREAQSASEEALVNATQRLSLAEGRYETGVGNAIELGDAQLALSNARAQRVQSVFNLAVARAQLVKALGRP